VPGHGRAHDAQADETDVEGLLAHGVFLVYGMRALIQPRPSVVWPAGLYSQPIQPCSRSRPGAEQEGVVDLARARLVAAGVVGQLDVGDARQVLLHGGGQLAFHALHVVDVVLQEQVVAPTSSSSASVCACGSGRSPGCRRC
jgi:hypothetical protein